MKAPRTIDYEDVDDIIGVASELQTLESDRLSVEDLTAVGRDLDIPDRYMKPAIEELARRRAALLAAEARRRARRRMVVTVALIAIGVLIAWALFAQSQLGSLAATAAAKRSQIANVVERQRATVAQWKDSPTSDQKSAELSGAENRVRIERREYDLVAAAYNAKVSGFPGSLWAAIFGHPEGLPLSNALDHF